MTEFLRNALLSVTRRIQKLRLARQLTICWLAAAILGGALLLLQRLTGWSSLAEYPLVTALAVTASIILYFRNASHIPSSQTVAREIEEKYPDLRGLLVTAVGLLEAPVPVSGYLSERVLADAVAHAQKTQRWRLYAPPERVRGAMGFQYIALAVFAFILWEGRSHVRGGGAGHWTWSSAVTVTPGDAAVERGESFVVLGRFGGELPPGVDLVVNEGDAPARRITLVKSLADPVFGGSIPEVTKDFAYHLEYGATRTANFSVKVFEHPRLERADADLIFPSYTKLGPKRIEDTHRVSAVEGTKVSLTLQLNKPVAKATLVAHDAAHTEIPLEVASDKKATARLPVLPFAHSETYDLKLVDTDNRPSRASAPFVIQVLPNLPPEIKLIAPRGDLRPSPIEEVAFSGTVIDDFGTTSYGLGYTVAGQPTQYITLGAEIPGREKRAFASTLRLEDLNVKPDDLVSWFAWADDFGPDGKVRRTSTDLYFGEVRPFDEIFRESQSMGSDDQDPAGGGAGQQAQKLTELEKQIISATWKLQKEKTGEPYAKDAAVVRESQQQALTQAQSTQAEATSPRAQALWQGATKKMEDAVNKLIVAESGPAQLPAALAAEQGAYQALLTLQARETEVGRRNRNGRQGGQGGNQRQIDQLDLAVAENRYETQTQARAPQSPERREQNQVLSRLQELARRQQDVNDRLKEMQTALQAAQTEPEREEVRKQLKRLEEEQRQMLADMDEVQQRMQRPESQTSAQQQSELDQTRQDLQHAADAAGQGSVAQALASGTRAQRQLQQMRDEVRKQNSSEFSEDLRQMRSDARDLAGAQEDLSRKLAAKYDTSHKSLSDAPAGAPDRDQLEQQRKRLGDLVDRATQLSEQAENSEPLLARQLYDTVRQLTQDDTKTVKDFREQLLEQGMLTRDLNDHLEESTKDESKGKTLDLASQMLRLGYQSQAGQALTHASAGVNEFKRGVERAAETVLGDDIAALKLAQSELDSVTNQLKKEMNDGSNPGSGGKADEKNAATKSGRTAAQGDPSAPQTDSQKVASDSQAQGNSTTPSDGSPGQAGNQGANRSQQADGSAGSDGARASGLANDSNPRDANRTGDRRAGIANDLDLNANGPGSIYAGPDALAGWGGGPLTGDDFGAWTDRLRDIEQLVDQPAWRDAVANARERARRLRQNYTRDHQKPDWAVVRTQIIQPLAEVQSRIGEELARRDSSDSLVPIDRDPVPNRYADSVRRYYEELGKDK